MRSLEFFSNNFAIQNLKIMERKEEKIVIICTAGPENPERATLPFVVATAAQSMDVKVTIILQSNAVFLAKKGMAEHVKSPGLPPLKQLMDTYRDLGGEFLLCTPCCKEREIPESDLIPGAKLIAAATVVDELLSATSSLVY